MYFLGKKRFFKFINAYTRPMRMGFGEIGVSVQIRTFHLIYNKRNILE